MAHVPVMGMDMDVDVVSLILVMQGLARPKSIPAFESVPGDIVELLLLGGESISSISLTFPESC